MKSLLGFYTLVEQEFYRFWRLIRQTIYTPILNTLLFVIIFGFSLGSRIDTLHGFSYILYIIPGLAAQAVIGNAFSNTSTSLYMARFDQSIDNLLVAPLRPIELVGSLVIGGILRGLLIGVLTLAVALPILKQPLYSYSVTFLCFFLQSVVFGCWGIIGALQAKTWDNLATTQNFVITPLTYLAGVFYSVDLLPPFWKAVSHFNPIFYMVDTTRYAVLGVHDAPIWIGLSVTAGVAAVLFGLCVYLFHIGYKLVR